MAEYIEREALIKRCKEIADCDWNKRAAPVSWSDAYEIFSDMLEEAPAADVVEVVRCKDCKNCTLDAVWGRYWCDRGIGVIQVKPNDFCSYGVRRGEE